MRSQYPIVRPTAKNHTISIVTGAYQDNLWKWVYGENGGPSDLVTPPTLSACPNGEVWDPGWSPGVAIDMRAYVWSYGGAGNTTLTVRYYLECRNPTAPSCPTQNPEVDLLVATRTITTGADYLPADAVVTTYALPGDSPLNYSGQAYYLKAKIVQSDWDSSDNVIYSPRAVYVYNPDQCNNNVPPGVK